MVTVQAAVPPVGLVEVTALPMPSTATQRLILGQEIPVNSLAPLTLRSVNFQAATPPVGLVDVIRSPLSSTAIQRVLLGQETAARLRLVVKWANFQVAAPPVGFVEVITSPPPKATHRVTLGQDTPPM